MAVTAILSLSVTSSSLFRWAARVLRYIGMEDMAATPLTLAEVIGAIPKSDESGRPGGDEVGRAGQKRVVHHGGAADIDPAHPDVRVLFDE